MLLKVQRPRRLLLKFGPDGAGEFAPRPSSPRGALLAGPGSMAAKTSRQTQRRAATTGQPGLITPIATGPLILLPRRSQMSERLHSSTILARIVLQSTVSLSPGDKFSSGS